MTKPLILLGKLIATISSKFNLGSGGTWPGHVALMLNPGFIGEMLSDSQTKVVFIVGTNGKTTTSMMLSQILKEDGKRVFRNVSGANLLNGIASSLLMHANKSGKVTTDYAVFEVDENFLPIALSHVTPNAVVALNLFRDQLDRYGELDSIAKKWNTAFRHLPETTHLILNADDPLISYLAKDVKAKVAYFGLQEKEASKKTVDHAADSLYCPNCGHKLDYKGAFFSHLGLWSCPSCGIKRPLPHLSESSYPLPGLYNEYNTLAAVLTAKELSVSQKIIDEALKKITPAFGRQEKISYKGHDVMLFLAKNPTSMNESLRTIAALSYPAVIASKAKQSHKNEEEIATSHQAPRNDKAKATVLFILNDRIPDGQDVSWIWDIDVEPYLKQFISIGASGDRTYDMAVRLFYAGQKDMIIEENTKDALDALLSKMKENDTLYILPTYSAMLDVRKILTGRKIL